MVPLLNDEQQARFIAMAEAGIAADQTPGLIKCDLSETFDLDIRQVANLLKRHKIRLFETRADLRVMLETSNAEQIRIVDRAKELLAQGKSRERVRCELSVEFHMAEISVAKLCKSAGGIEIRHEQYIKAEKENEKLDEAVRIPLEKADYDPSRDVFKQAAEKLREKKHDVRFDEGREQWWLDNRPVSRVELAQAAGMGC